MLLRPMIQLLSALEHFILFCCAYLVERTGFVCSKNSTSIACMMPEIEKI